MNNKLLAGGAIAIVAGALLYSQNKASVDVIYLSLHTYLPTRQFFMVNLNRFRTANTLRLCQMQ